VCRHLGFCPTLSPVYSGRYCLSSEIVFTPRDTVVIAVGVWKIYLLKKKNGHIHTRVWNTHFLNVFFTFSHTSLALMLIYSTYKFSSGKWSAVEMWHCIYFLSSSLWQPLTLLLPWLFKMQFYQNPLNRGMWGRTDEMRQYHAFILCFSCVKTLQVTVFRRFFFV
jgi:hypothetical protein